MTRVTSLAAKLYRLKCRHGPTGVYLKQFGHREDDNCWWCSGAGRMAAQARGNIFGHCSRWSDQQNTLGKVAGYATGRNADRWKHLQICKLMSRDVCDQVVVDFLAGTEVGKFPPK
jgi:hypothetical protein